MSIQPIIGYTATCNHCARAFVDENGKCQLWVDSADQAAEYIQRQGWRVIFDVVGIENRVVCHNCLVLGNCWRLGHDWGPRIRCDCGGRIHLHHVGGYGLLRSCRRDGCHRHQDITFANPPTISVKSSR